MSSDNDFIFRKRKAIALLKLNNECIDVPFNKRTQFILAVQRALSNDYSLSALKFALAWAVAMQQEMRHGKKVADIAKRLSNEVDYQIISGANFIQAISFLTLFWKHGEELRQWHNIDVLGPEKGQELNDQTNQIVDPSNIIITIK